MDFILGYVHQFTCPQNQKNMRLKNLMFLILVFKELRQPSSERIAGWAFAELPFWPHSSQLLQKNALTSNSSALYS